MQDKVFIGIIISLFFNFREGASPISGNDTRNATPFWTSDLPIQQSSTQSLFTSTVILPSPLATGAKPMQTVKASIISKSSATTLESGPNATLYPNVGEVIFLILQPNMFLWMKYHIFQVKNSKFNSTLFVLWLSELQNVILQVVYTGKNQLCISKHMHLPIA